LIYENLPAISHQRSGKTNPSFLKTNNIAFIEEEEQEEELPQHVLDGIKRGQEDVAAGRTITFEEFKKRRYIS
jgi:predicted transcriptional regulator